MNHRGDFNLSLQIGRSREEIILNVIKRKYREAYLCSGYKKEHDIFIPEIGKSIEVKCDIECYRTGNFALEYGCNDRPSGIATTDALGWIIFCGEDVDVCYYITVENLKKIGKTIGLRRTKAMLDCVSDIILVPMELLLQQATLIRTE